MKVSDPAGMADARTLAKRLIFQWQAERRVEDLRAAVDVLRESVSTAADPDTRAASRADLGAALQIMYEIEGDSVEVAVGYLDEAIANTRDLIEDLPEGRQQRRQFANLANALRAKHDATTDAQSVLDGVAAARRSLGCDDPAAEMSERTSNLALLLRARFVRFGAFGDIKEAVDLLRQAVPAARPQIRHLIVSNLADTLAVRGYRFQRVADLTEAVHLSEQTLFEHQPYERGGLLTNAGLAALELYRLTNESRQVRRAVSMLAAAVDEYTPAVELSARLGNLSKARRLAFTASADLGDLDAAVDLAREALSKASQVQDRVQSAAGLARALWARWEVTTVIADAEESIEWRAKVASNGSAAPGDRLDSARVAGDCATRLGRHESAVAAYSLALDLATVLGLIGLDRRSAEFETARLSGLATDAAAASVASGDPEKALFEVDRGRATLWAGLRGLRSRLPGVGGLDGRADPRVGLVALAHPSECDVGNGP
ncbi:hypothetical protein [Rhodococcoides kyotonense]|uniref:Tetratricopeptide repeat-containing protein n=1 Tax=Rhodococcoides kyotonense TaxID=398843 RepID=A0A239N0G6_9NOCA|nr:hypothetical protein [Rhodococcus kyotonensis]SNT47963.1 hypothetical protein SAMN05421642_12533 [Rhodococcus kyotonensis]